MSESQSAAEQRPDGVDPATLLDDDHPAVVRVEDGTYYRTVRRKAYVADLRDEFAFTSDVTERTLAAFDREGIDTPVEPPIALSE
ncbi:hypothetical protein Harman_22240 [Haloarcula mannanilytica]|uniref:Uncharacterized protein n=1 Tax=Haloarcula mannanilytica TaxID=2509225 RepID=A0A4C2EQ40_9EURY|nr:hypothetical protein [Haloarcula mannanilytica]GCF14289.1 hypothetical protein Harman_22240 [Haloarcula mannanilytica]